MKSAAEMKEPRQRLVTLLRTYADFAVRNPETYRLSFMEVPRFTEKVFRTAPLEGEGGAGRQAFATIVQAVRDLKASKRVAREETTKLAEVLWAGVHGVVSLKLIYPAFPTHPTETLVDKMIQLLLDRLH